MYLYIKDNIAINLIPEFDDNLPGIPLNQRYTPDILKNTVEVPENVEVKLGWLVDTATWTFTEPPAPAPPINPEMPLGFMKEQAIQQTRDWVEAELKKGMLYKDGKIYNVTREKRADLAGVILVGKMNEENGVPDDKNILRWNVSGEEHEDWLYKDLCALAYTMYIFVTPTIEKQQHAEIQIKGAETYDEIQTILQDFM